MEDFADLQARIQESQPRLTGERSQRQPVHTVYGGADLFRPDTARRLGDLALAALERYAPDPGMLADSLPLETDPSDLYERVREKLVREPVEDFRLDFEDGYGLREDREEDGHARSSAEAVAFGFKAGTLPPFIGIRLKPLTAGLAGRSLRTLRLFLAVLLEGTAGELPGRFVVTLPKVEDTEQVAVLAEALTRLEEGAGLPPGAVPMEIMIETTGALFDPDGRIQVLRLVQAGEGRVRGAHFGTYDYTASCNITAAYQSMTHPACDFARHVMQVSLAATGVWLSDGSTNVLPVPIHRDEELTDAQEAENRASMNAAWRKHFSEVRHSLVHGFYQGWDLHPAQLVTRHAAVFDFFRSGLEAASERLRNLVARAAQASLLGEVFDDAATGQGLLNFFLRAVNSGAISEAEATARSGLSLDELHTRSFGHPLARRYGSAS